MRLLEHGEGIVVVIRKHWLVFVLRLLVLLFGALLPLLAAGLLPQDALQNLSSIGGVDTTATFLYIVWLFILWIFAFAMWTNYFLDIWIVTDKRLIDIDQKGLFRREITTTRLEKVQDVTVAVEGVLGTLFGFGNIVIHTAGDNPDIYIRNALNPGGAKERIMEAYNLVLDRGIKKDFV